MEIQTKQDIEREQTARERQRKRYFEEKLEWEFVERDNRYTRCKEKFQNSLAFSLGLPALLTGFSYLLENSQPAELGALAADITRQMASWAYMAFSPFTLVYGMRMAREKGARNVLLEAYHESRNPGAGKIGDGRIKK